MPSDKEKDLMQGYWESYSKWQQDARTGNKNSVASAKASMAVQGIGPDSPIYQSTLSRLGEEFKGDIASIEAGQTKASLDKYYNDDKKAYAEYLFGANDKYSGATDQDRELLQNFRELNVSDTLYKDTGNVDKSSLINQRASLIEQRNNLSMEDYYTSQFSIAGKNQDTVKPQGKETTNQKLPGTTQEPGPWW